MITPAFSVSSKISKTLTTATLVKNFKAGFRGVGSNVAVLGNVTTDWGMYGSMGQNLTRYHHLATAIRQGWMSVGQVVASMTNAQNAGVRGCMDLIDNLGEQTKWGLYGFKERICAFDPEAEKILEDYIQDIQDIL